MKKKREAEIALCLKRSLHSQYHAALQLSTTDCCKKCITMFNNCLRFRVVILELCDRKNDQNGNANVANTSLRPYIG